MKFVSRLTKLDPKTVSINLVKRVARKYWSTKLKKGFATKSSTHIPNSTRVGWKNQNKHWDF